MITSNVHIVDRDLGFKELVRILRQSKKFLAVGLPEKVGTQVHPDSDKTLAEIGTINEFGLGVPARPFISGTIDKNKARYETAMRTIGDHIIAKTTTIDMGMKQLGELIVGDIKENIEQGIPPPNAESTIRRKGSSKPLIDTGVLRNSITYDIRDDDRER